MSMLPVEVVEYIFEYLISLEDRKSASLVCQQWYRAYLNPCFRQYEIVNITADRQLKTLLEIENWHRNYLNFVMKNIDITEESLPFWDRYGRHIKNLTFYSCYIREKMFVKAVSKCIRLESLTIHDCKELLMTGLSLEEEEIRNLLGKALQNLKTLSFSYNRYLSDAILIKVLAFCPNLTALILNGCQISYHRGMFRKFYPDGMKTPSDSVTTFQMFLRYLNKNANKIKKLSLSDTLIDSDSLNNLSQVEKLELSVLDLKSCMQLSNQGLIQMCGNLKALTELDVGLCPRITDTSLIVLCYSLPLLTKLSLQGCRAISDMGLANIWQLEQLECLNLSECELLQGGGILRGLCHKTNKKIRELRLSHLGQISEAVVIGIAEFLPNLRHLDLGFCFNAVTDTSLQAIFKHSIWLRSLNLAMCDRITDCGMTGMGVQETTIVPSVPQLMRLPLGSKFENEILRDAKVKEEVQELCENEMLHSNKSGISLKRLRGLQRLNLTGCKRISDVSLKYAFMLKELKALDLSHCQLVTSGGLGHLVTNCPAIEELNLDFCQNVDDDGVEYVVRDLTRLKSVILGSNKVTNTISIFIQNNAIQLTYIDVRHCGQITGSGVGHLFHSLPFLQTFHYPETRADNEGIIPQAPFGLWLRKS